MPFKLLVVEDNVDSRTLLHHLLNLKGYVVSTAVDGAEGVYMAKSENPDLIITDLAMPNVDGLEMIKQLRTDPETADLPVILYTAFGSSDTAQEAMEAGATRIFSKPFDLERMLHFILESLGAAGDD